METKIFDLRDLDMASAYDVTQMAEAIRHGDVLLVADGVAVLDQAWPVMVCGRSDVFHRLADGATWERVALDMAAHEGDRLLAGVATARRPLAELATAAVPWFDTDAAELADLIGGAA